MLYMLGNILSYIYTLVINTRRCYRKNNQYHFTLKKANDLMNDAHIIAYRHIVPTYGPV